MTIYKNVPIVAEFRSRDGEKVIGEAKIEAWRWYAGCMLAPTFKRLPGGQLDLVSLSLVPAPPATPARNETATRELVSVLDQNVLCPGGCGTILHRAPDNTLECRRIACVYFNRRFRRPTVSLELLPEGD